MWVRTRPFLTAVTIWQLVCLAFIFIYPYFFRPLVDAAYTWEFGDLQAGYRRYPRLAIYWGILAITTPATLVSLLLFDRLRHRSVSWKVNAIFFCGWQLLVVLCLIWSYEIGFPYMINQLTWEILGPPKELYSFSNLVIPRVIAWLVCTGPVGCMVLWMYSKTGRRTAKELTQKESLE
jgi:hypothetical protein